MSAAAGEAAETAAPVPMDLVGSPAEGKPTSAAAGPGPTGSWRWRRPLLALIGGATALLAIALVLGAARDGSSGPRDAWNGGTTGVDSARSGSGATALAPAAPPAPEDFADRSDSPLIALAPRVSPGGEPAADEEGSGVEGSRSTALSTSIPSHPPVSIDPGAEPAPVPMPSDPPRVAQLDGGMPAPRRIRVQTESGRVVAARVHGEFGNEVSVLLPDGQLGFPRALVYTDEPFRAATAEEMIPELLAGPFAGFHVRQSAHYVVLYQSTAAFAEASLKLLEELYQGLTRAFSERDIPVHDPEFPLVAVIFRTERDFRAHKKVDPDVQAYYEIFTNRIYFYQASERDEHAPEIAAMRKPQTVAHEGTHQILQNIGVQPRLSSWPLWLVEGLAEYCAAPVSGKKGVSWKALGVVNPLHMATIRDLEDPLSMQVAGPNRARIGRDPRMPLIEYLVTRKELTPTDYALAWALTHYLAMKKGPQFVAFMKTMSQVPPLKQVSADEHLATFRAAFGNDLVKMDHAVASYLSKLKGYDQLPYYAVMFEQRIGPAAIKRAAIVSQSTSMIRQWLETVSLPDGPPPSWKAVPHPTRARAEITVEQWMRSQ